MPSIVGEKYRNATSSDVALIDEQILQHEAALKEATGLLTECMANTLRNPFYSCHKRLGRSKSNIEAAVVREKTALSELRKKRELIVASIEQTTGLAIQESTASKEEAEADALVAESRGKQFMVYGGILAVLIIAGLVFYKKIKGKK